MFGRPVVEGQGIVELPLLTSSYGKPAEMVGAAAMLGDVHFVPLISSMSPGVIAPITRRTTAL